MKRITRLLTGSPPEDPGTGKRWRWPAALAILLASGTLLATTTRVGNLLPSINIQSTTDGTLRPGDSREIRASGLDKDRFYRASVDRQGTLSERYEENGKAIAINAKTRAWINEMSRISVPPPPPAPPAPPAAPAAPPPPPAPPNISESATFKEILRLVAADQAVIRAMGNPLTVLPDSIDGNIRLSGVNDSAGEAQLKFDLSGPNGRNTVTVAAERENGTWNVVTLNLRPLDQ